MYARVRYTEVIHREIVVEVEDDFDPNAVDQDWIIDHEDVSYETDSGGAENIDTEVTDRRPRRTPVS